MIIDAHLNCSGNEKADDVLRALDEAGVDMGVLLAPFLNAPYTLHDRHALRAANVHLSKLVKDHPDRLIGLAVVNPLLDGAPEDLRYAIEDLGLTGLKMVPTGWYPYDDCAHRVYEEAARLALPVLFHSGIFIDGISGRYCRPAFYEAVRAHPGMRVTLAHLGWPWCDEAIAVGVIDLINGVPPEQCQIRFDFSYGPPPIYRKEALRKALSVLGPGLIQFGSDRFFPCSGAHIKELYDDFNRILDELEVSSVDRDTMHRGCAANWLGLK